VDDDSQGQDRTEVLEAEVRGLTETVAVLQAQLAALLDPVRLAADAPVEGAAPRADAGSTPAPHEQGPAPETRISRRGALALGAAAAVGLGAVADSVLAATPAAAATGNMQYGASNNAVTAGTDLTSTATGETLSIENTAGEGNALSVSVTDALSAGSAIYAVNAGQNNTVKALSNNVDNLEFGAGSGRPGGEHLGVRPLRPGWPGTLVSHTGHEPWPSDHRHASRRRVLRRLRGLSLPAPRRRPAAMVPGGSRWVLARHHLRHRTVLL